GLGEFAAFYIGEERVAAEWDADEKTYTIRGLTQEQVNELSVLQAAGVAAERVHVTAWTVESDGGDESERLEGDFELEIGSQSATGGDDSLLYSGGLLDGGDGEDTIWLRDGDGIDFGKVDTDIRNIEKVDLLGGDHFLFGITIDDVVAMVGESGTLTIDADGDDEIAFYKPEGGPGWYHDRSDQDGYDYYKYLLGYEQGLDGEDTDDVEPDIHTAQVRIKKGAAVDTDTLIDALEPAGAAEESTAQEAAGLAGVDVEEGGVDEADTDEADIEPFDAEAAAMPRT